MLLGVAKALTGFPAVRITNPAVGNRKHKVSQSVRRTLGSEKHLWSAATPACCIFWYNVSAVSFSQDLAYHFKHVLPRGTGTVMRRNGITLVWNCRAHCQRCNSQIEEALKVLLFPVLPNKP